MTSPTHRAECSAAALYVGIELSLREWFLTLRPRPAAGPMRVRVRPGDRAAVVYAITRATARFGLPPAAPVRSCYEAGRDGFWPHRFLATLGVENLVVDSSSIEVPRRRRRAKTDRIDGEKLLQLLLRHWGGERQMWQVVHVPSPARGGCPARQSEPDDAPTRADTVSQPDPQSAGVTRCAPPGGRAAPGPAGGGP